MIDDFDEIFLAGGCFWGLELAFQRVPGVLNTEVGYIGGHTPDPTYREVCGGNTGHTEAVRIEFNPSVVSLDELLTVFWDRIDPTLLNRQGNDVGTQYRTGIFYQTKAQKEVAEQSLEREQEKHIKDIVTEITAHSGLWWPAERYHQQYLEKGGQCADKGEIEGIRCYG